jgi:arginine/lysine/ornithine decarboxylase
MGFACESDESLKIVITSQKNRCSCEQLANHLREFHIEPEYAECDALVIMFSTESTEIDFKRIKTAFATFSCDNSFEYQHPAFSAPKRSISIREALFAQSERIPVQNAFGRVCASPSVSCPPAIPPVISGELIDANTVKILLYYGIDEINVVKE